jgi:hypothetical protein
MKANLITFVGGTALLWAVCTLVSWNVHGESGILFTAVACALCLVPMLATLIWTHRVQGGTSEAKLAAAMGGTGLRMMVVLLGGVTLFINVPALHHVAFMLWLIVFYLATLAIEVSVAVRGIMSEAGQVRAPESASSSQPR